MRSIKYSGFDSREYQQVIDINFYHSLKKRFEDVSRDFSYSTSFHFVSYVDDLNIKKQLRDLKLQKETKDLKTIFVVGIGGANLGAKAAIEAFPKKEYDRDFIFLDTLFEGEIDYLKSLVFGLKSIDEFLLIIISKSGKTIETLANAKMVSSLLEDKFGSVNNRIITVTGESSPLETWAKHESVSCITITNKLSERYGFFSPVTMVPLVFSGLSIDDLYSGGRDALKDFCRDIRGDGSEFFKLASILNNLVKSNSNIILDLFFFCNRLESVGKWHRQLIAESLGKSETKSGNKFSKSITPTISIGTTDLHSILQLYLSQTENRVSWFFNAGSDHKEKIGTSEVLKLLLPKLSNETPEHVLKLIYDSILETYRENNIPYIESAFDSINEYNLGYQMMGAMLVVVSIASIWDIDPFNQPHVEGYKSIARNTLE